MRVLLVEDDPVSRRVVEHALSSRGHEVVWFDNGDLAWDEYQRTAFPLVILDWMVPGIDGLELCARIRSHRRGANSHILVVTARDKPSDLKSVLEAGADDYFPKPISVKLLEVRLTVAERQVENLLERRKAETALQRAFSELERSNDDLISILNLLRIGTALIDERSCVTFLSRKAQEITDRSDNEVLNLPWDQGLPFPSADCERISVQLLRPQPDRKKIAIKLSTKSGIQKSIELEVRDDPRTPQRKILLLYDVSEVEELRRQLDDKARFHELVGKSQPMQQVYRLIQDLGAVDTTVLIQGETGTGKELVARAIHASSHRKDRPFIAFNCAGLTESLVASQLFGHRRGAFTGAVEDRIGMFEAAKGGTIFLDEIGDVPTTVQISLLRVLEAKEIQRVGEVGTRKVDVRILSATNRDLSALVSSGEFRQDLLYRLRVARIDLPPLRERREDIMLLVEWFLRQVGAATGKSVESVSDDACRTLLSYSWPGNVRELRNAIEFGIIRSRGNVLREVDLPPEISEVDRKEGFWAGGSEGNEKQAILAALERVRGNRSKAAQLLGMSRATFYRRLADYGIETKN